MRKWWSAGMAVAVLMAGSAFGAETVKRMTVRTRDAFGTDATDVLNFCNMKVGDAFSQEAVSRDERALLDTGRFTYAAIHFQQLDDGVEIIIEVVRRYRFQGPLAIKGNTYLSEAKLRKVTELKSGDYIDDAVLAVRAQKIRDEYVKRFFRSVEVARALEPIEGSAGFAQVTFTITEGERQKIKDFVFVNNISVPAAELRSSFGEFPWWDPRGWFTDTPISDQDLEEARQKAEDVYRDKGFLDAKVDFPTVEQAGTEKVNMVFNVTEGDVYTVESVAVRGTATFTESMVMEGVALKPDMLCGQKAINDAVKAVRDFYGARGYVDTVVFPLPVKTVPGQPGRAILTFEVREGRLAYIRNIVIRGNNKTKDKVLRREIRVSPGEVVDEVRIERSENRLKNLNYFKDVRHYTEKTDNDDQRDVVYEVEEQRTGNFMVGAGFSSVDQLVGFINLSQSNFDILNWPNFTGGGQKARVGAEIGMRNQAGEISWTEPWFLDRPMALSVDLYYRNLWYRQYDVTRTGAGAGLSYPVTFGRVGVSYTLEQVDLKSVDNGHWSLTPPGSDSFDTGWGDWGGEESDRYFRKQKDDFGGNINSVGRLYWERDTRDQPFVPTRGYRAFLFGDLSEGGIGDNQFWKVGGNYRHWVQMPWAGKHVLSLRGRAETIDAYSDELPIYEKLFMGGPRTVRGVKYRDAGPKVWWKSESGYVSDSHAPIGGQTLVLGSAEYSIPVFKAFRLAAFVDAGSLGEGAFGDGMSGVVVSAGVGVRIDIPGFPIRFDIAKPFKKDDDYTEEEIFSFSIGFE